MFRARAAAPPLPASSIPSSSWVARRACLAELAPTAAGVIRAAAVSESQQAALLGMSKLRLALLCLLAVGVLDHLFAIQSSADSTVRRLGLHQDKSQAYWLYFFIAHIYDGILVR